MGAGGGLKGRRGRMGTAKEGALAFVNEGPLGFYALEQEAAACCALYWPGATRRNYFKCAVGPMLWLLDFQPQIILCQRIILVQWLVIKLKEIPKSINKFKKKRKWFYLAL